MKYQRHLISPLLEALSDTPVVLLHGARQTGKSTLVQELGASRGARYVTLDDMTVLAAASSDAEGFVAALQGPVVIDEVQRAPELFLAIKAAVDRDRRPGRFLLTGSANVMMLPRLAESLVGRLEILTLWPLSQGELEGTRDVLVDAMFAPQWPALADIQWGRAELADRMLRGGFPEAQSRQTAARRGAWFRNYVTTLLQRDIRDLAHIESLTDMSRLLSVLAGRMAALLNVADLGRTLAMPQTSLKRYLALLEATFLVQTLPAWTVQIGRRMVKTPRLLLTDTGLAAALLDLSAQRLEENPSLFGVMLENFVAMELKKQIGWSRTSPSMWHYRTHQGIEVDIVLESADGRIVGVEIKAGRTLSGDDWRGLKLLREETGPRFLRGMMLYGGSQVVPFGENLLAVPLPYLWQSIELGGD